MGAVPPRLREHRRASLSCFSIRQALSPKPSPRYVAACFHSCHRPRQAISSRCARAHSSAAAWTKLCVCGGCLECMLIANLIRCELTSGAAWTKLFGLPEIVMLKELHQRAPVLLKNTIMSVDVMADASEQVLSLHADGLLHCMLMASLIACRCSRCCTRASRAVPSSTSSGSARPR